MTSAHGIICPDPGLWILSPALLLLILTKDIISAILFSVSYARIILFPCDHPLNLVSVSVIWLQGREIRLPWLSPSLC